jgi:predicted S18 family serine protease
MKMGNTQALIEVVKTAREELTDAQKVADNTKRPDNACAANNKAKAKAEVTAKKLSFDTGKKDKKGKAIRREFPVMFSIADRARKHKAKKAGKK